MGQSLVQNYVHIVFSTKKRQPFIKPPYEQELHAYIGGLCKEFDCPVLAVGGYTDHIHILCMLSRKLALMTLIQKVKTNSSRWTKTKDPVLKAFKWQDGYGTFSVSPKEVDNKIKYIKNQHEHHKTKSFKEEYLDLLKKHNIDYNPDYIWD